MSKLTVNGNNHKFISDENGIDIANRDTQHSTNGSVPHIIISKDNGDEDIELTSPVNGLKVDFKQNANNNKSGTPPEKQSLREQLCSWRMMTYVLLQWSYISLNFPRTTTNFALVCIENKRDDVLSTWNSTYGSGVSAKDGMGPEDVRNDKNESIRDVYGDLMSDLNWDSATKNLILSAPLFLAFLSPLLGDALRPKIGNKNVMQISLTVAMFVAATTAEFARISAYLVLANQLMFGLVMGANIPVVSDTISKWTPEHHRLSVNAFIYAGFSLGSVISSFLNGFLCLIPFDNGWPFIYYNSSFLVFIYTVILHFTMTDTPETHPYISEKEKNYILSSRSSGIQVDQNKKPERPPYMLMLRSLPVISFVLLMIAFVWTMSVTFIYLPMYLSKVLGFSTQETGATFSSLILIRCLGAFVWAIIGNILTNKGILSSASTRKLCICLGLGVAGLATLALSFFDYDNRLFALGSIVLMMFAQSVSTSHITTLPLDMAPRYAGTITSMALSLGSLVAPTGPLIVAVVAPRGTYDEWRYLWIIIAAIYLTASMIFLTIGKATVQPWAQGLPSSTDNPELHVGEMWEKEITRSLEEDEVEDERRTIHQILRTLSQTLALETVSMGGSIASYPEQKRGRLYTMRSQMSRDSKASASSHKQGRDNLTFDGITCLSAFQGSRSMKDAAVQVKLTSNGDCDYISNNKQQNQPTQDLNHTHPHETRSQSNEEKLIEKEAQNSTYPNTSIKRSSVKDEMKNMTSMRSSSARSDMDTQLDHGKLDSAADNKMFHNIEENCSSKMDSDNDTRNSLEITKL